MRWKAGTAANEARGAIAAPTMRSPAALSGPAQPVWDNPGVSRSHRLHSMTTRIQQADLIESVAAALQYIS
jgi:hypothetical protein